MLQMERDLETIQNKIVGSKNTDVGHMPGSISKTFQTNMIRSFHHTTMNRKREFEIINKENQRMFAKLKNQ